jgi:membrane fusion protein, multidrug efflux system
LLLGTETNVVAVAAPSVQHGPNGLYVYEVGQGNTVKMQPIQVSRQEGGVYVVSSGLTDGAVVVATGQSRLQSGTRVSVRDGQAASTAATKSGS